MSEAKLAKPVVKKRRWPHLLVWLVPLAAAAALGFYFLQYRQEHGPKISVTFEDASGLKEGETKVLYRGVDVGSVSAVKLAKDHSHVVVEVELHQDQKDFARTGAAFWIVRPEVSFSGITGLNTILSGPYIGCWPGSGETTTRFQGLSKQPVAQVQGLRIVLHAVRLEHLQQDAPVYFRGFQVGSIEKIELAPEADGVDLHVFIQPRYAVLVHSNSKFWIVNPVDIKGGIFTGVELKVEPLRALVSGGIMFATPEEDMGPQSAQDSQFGLYEEPESKWLNWSPRIKLPPPSPEEQETTPLPNGNQALNSAIRG